MKITKQQLKQIIKEELHQLLLAEDLDPWERYAYGMGEYEVDDRWGPRARGVELLDLTQPSAEEEAETAYDAVRKGGGVRVHGGAQPREATGADLETARGYDREVRAQRGGTFDIGADTGYRDRADFTTTVQKAGEDAEPVVVSRQLQRPGRPTVPSVNPPHGIAGHIPPPPLGHEKLDLADLRAEEEVPLLDLRAASREATEDEAIKNFLQQLVDIEELER